MTRSTGVAAGALALAVATSAVAQCDPVRCGPIIGWGDNSFGQQNGPAGRYMDMSVKASGTLVIRDDGTMLGGGNNPYGQSTPQAGTFIGVAHGMTHSVALRSDGTVIAWGLDAFQTGCTMPPPIQCKRVFADDQISGGLTPDGMVVIWGGPPPNNLPVPQGSGYLDLALSAFFLVAVRSDGTLVASGQDGLNRTQVPEGTYSKVRIGSSHCLALRTDQTIAAWGSNLYGQCDVPPGTYSDIAAGTTWSAGLRTDGTIVAWGRNTVNQLEVPTGKFLAITAGGGTGLAIAACYANCDLSTTAPVLNVNDFVCFISGFASGASWANCDRSTSPPILNVNDFICFASSFAAGCDS